MEIDETEKKLHTQEGTEPSAMSETDVSCKTSYFHKDSENLSESQEDNADFEEWWTAQEIRQRIKAGDKTALKDLKEHNAEVALRKRKEGLNIPSRQNTQTLIVHSDKPLDALEYQLAEGGSYVMESNKTAHQIRWAVGVAKNSLRDNISYSEQDGKFRIYDFRVGYWSELGEMYLGNMLKDFAIRMGCYALDMQLANSIEGLIKQAKFEFLQPFEPKSGLLNLQNGTYDFENDVFREHRAADCLNYALDYEYNPDAPRPKWDKFLAEVLVDEVRWRFQEVVGNTFLDHRHETMGYLLGGGCNGKSTALDGISAALGQRNITGYTLAQITDEEGRARAGMVGKLLNISSDDGVEIKDFGRFKAYISDELQSAKLLYQNSFTVSGLPKTIVAANALPKTTDLSDGLFRRFTIIPFDKKIPKENIDVELKSKLIKERAGILNWMIEGARRLRKQGEFSESPIVDGYLDRYRRDSDTVALFLDDKGFKAGNELRVGTSDLFKQYDEWRKDNNYAVMGSRTFHGRMAMLGFEARKSGSKYYSFSVEVDDELESAEKEAISRLPF